MTRRLVVSFCAALGTALLVLSACTAHAHSPRSQSGVPGASAVVASLGAVPIPSGGPAEPTATARIGRPAVLAMGAPVQVELSRRNRLLAVALGPDQTRTAPTGDPRSRQSTPATVTFRVTALTGAVTITCTDLSSHDETGRTIALSPVGPATATARPGSPASLTVRGTFNSGAAQVTWRHDGHVLGIWTFTIEID